MSPVYLSIKESQRAWLYCGAPRQPCPPPLPTAPPPLPQLRSSGLTRLCPQPALAQLFSRDQFHIRGNSISDGLTGPRPVTWMQKVRAFVSVSAEGLSLSDHG